MIKLENYQEFLDVSTQPLIVVIGKTQLCTVCKPITHRLEQLMILYPTIPAYIIDVEKVEQFRGQHLIFTVPTIIVLEFGKEILRESRFVDFEKIKRLFDIYLDR